MNIIHEWQLYDRDLIIAGGERNCSKFKAKPPLLPLSGIGVTISPPLVCCCRRKLRRDSELQSIRGATVAVAIGDQCLIFPEDDTLFKIRVLRSNTLMFNPTVVCGPDFRKLLAFSLIRVIFPITYRSY
ncbi:unnamed protein product [Cuscuta epithymum]|uniref:Uncharacterized protein n=1 Tax=Cuscuta epithymum TaxID=186058 RepID=A0AAV0DDT6_9ASTE|nr:unnamed protein product [Cuscuta epithymum]